MRVNPEVSGLSR